MINMIVNKTDIDELELERLPLSLRFPIFFRHKKALITAHQQNMMQKHRLYDIAKQTSSIKTIQIYRHQLLTAIKQADEALNY